jgi:hypothetical protein
MLFLFVLACHSISTALGYDPPIARDGISGPIKGYTGLVYQAVDYVPVCGTLGPTSTSPIDMSTMCAPAMSVYNTTAELTAFYDTTGVRLSVNVASGTEGCLCFAVAMLSGNAGNICMWLSGFGEPSIYWSVATDNMVASSFQPGNKSLPQCKDVSIAAISSSVYANLPPPTVNTGTPNTAHNIATSNTLRGTATDTAGNPTDITTSTNDNGASPDGLTKPAEIATIVGSVIAFLGLCALIGCCRNRDGN